MYLTWFSSASFDARFLCAVFSWYRCFKVISGVLGLVSFKNSRALIGDAPTWSCTLVFMQTSSLSALDRMDRFADATGLVEDLEFG